MPKRSLVLAGGGLKVAFQAGVLQVWLDEAGLTFDHRTAPAADASIWPCTARALPERQSPTSGERWIRPCPSASTPTRHGGSVRPNRFSRTTTCVRGSFPSGASTGTRSTRRSGPERSLFNFSRKRLEVVTQDKVTEDRLVSAVSLPMWFPPVVIDGDTYIDAVFICDANVEEAIRRGADEIWAIWTVSTKEMRYRVFCRRSNGTLFTLSGFKKVESDTDVWTAATTLITSVYEGEVARGGENTAVIIGRGIIRLGLFDFLQQLTTFRVQGPTPAASFEALTRFGILFMGKLWDVYGRQFAGPATIG